MYKLNKFDNGVLRSENGIEWKTFIPFAPDNTDYANFKREINEGTAQLQNADGELMTAEQAKQFVKELP